LSESVSSIDKNNFNSAVRYLCRADTIYVFGSGSNESLATYLCFRLNSFRKKTVLIPDTDNNIFEKLILLTPKDFLVVYAFYKPTPDIISLLDFVHRRQIPNLLITDTRVPPMVRNAHLVLYAKRGPFGVFLSTPSFPWRLQMPSSSGWPKNWGRRLWKPCASSMISELPTTTKRYLTWPG